MSADVTVANQLAFSVGKGSWVNLAGSDSNIVISSRITSNH